MDPIPTVRNRAADQADRQVDRAAAALTVAKHRQRASASRRMGLSGGRTARIATPKPSSGAEPGVHALAKALGHEFGPFGVTANVVAPGWIDTERDWSQYPTVRGEKEIRRIPVRRIGTQRVSTLRQRRPVSSMAK
jgi:NAD(P)-dependent dehydrogenase (short-subunit alcohol dehydrogenase family)